jgi:hypothetical protein
MIDPKLLTEKNWKEALAKLKFKDIGMQKALAAYDGLDDDDYDGCLKVMGVANQCANNLKKSKDVAGVPAALKHINDLLAAIQAELKDLAKAKVDEQKVEALTQKKAEEAEKKQAEGGKDADQEAEEGAHADRLLSFFKKLKSNPDMELNFAICDAKPYVGLVISKQPIGSKHRTELTEISGGSKRFLKPGTCWVENGKLVFDMEDAPAGIAAKLKKAFKFFTGLNIGVMVGDQSDEDEAGESESAEHGHREQPAGEISPVALGKALQAWNKTRQDITTSLGELKKAVVKEFAGEPPATLSKMEKTMRKVDAVPEKLEELGDILDAALNEVDAARRQNILRNAKSLLARQIQAAAADPIIAHIDSNPFGIKTDLMAKLKAGMSEVAHVV